MKKMLKTAAAFLAATMIFILATACVMQTTSSVTYDVETGDSVTLKLITSDGYQQDAKIPFSITKDDKKVIQGTFITIEQYDAYISLVENGGSESEAVEIIEQGIKDENTFCFYSVKKDEATEYDFVMRIGESNTAVLMGSTLSESEARNCFDIMTFTLKAD